MVATAKHFPGDGNCLFDQHLTTAINPLSKEDWDNSYRKVYEEIIEGGVKAIMPGHIALPSYDEVDPETGLFPPATLSYNLLTKLLKENLCFQGLIISDATEMSGFCGYINYYKACARFLMAGGDCLLFTHPKKEYISEMMSLIKKKELTREVLENRALRVMSFVFDNDKCSLGENVDKTYSLSENQKIADLVVEKSVKIFRDRNNILPIRKKNIKIAHVAIVKQIEANIVSEFSKGLTKYGQVDELIDPGCNLLKEIAKKNQYDLIVVTIGCSQWFGTNQITLSGLIARNMMQGWMKYNTPVVFVDFGNPYIHEEYEGCIDTLIYTYGYAKNTIDCVLKKIFEQ